MPSIYNQWFPKSLWEDVVLPPPVRDIPAMLSQEEKAVYYLAACDWYSFTGKILDCGVLLGGTTTALIYGVLNNCQLLQNLDRVSQVIHVYDRFIVGDKVYIDFFHQFCGKQYSSGDNFYESHSYYMQAFQSFIELHAGDILHQFWQKEWFIEILCLDICKNENITFHIAREFFPHLLANRSVVIQQDYSNGWLPHAIYLMEIFEDKFEKIFEVNDLAAFKCVEQMEQEEIHDRLHYYHSDSNLLIELMDRAIENANTPDTLWFLKLAKAKLFGDNDDAVQGLAYLQKIEATASDEIRKLPTYQSNFTSECQKMRVWLISQQKKRSLH